MPFCTEVPNQAALAEVLVLQALWRVVGHWVPLVNCLAAAPVSLHRVWGLGTLTLATPSWFVGGRGLV
jgi:hypothetical protein